MEHMTDEQLEKLRGKAKRRFFLMLALTAAFFVGMLVFWSRLSALEGEKGIRTVGENLLVSGVLTLGAFFLLYLLFYHRVSQKFCHAFKEKYVLSTLWESGRFEELSYDPKKGFSYDDIRNSAVVNCGEKAHFSSEDMLRGRYKGIPFQFSDVLTQKVVIRQKKREVETIFHGQVIRLERFDSRKVSDGHLQIFQKEFLSDIRGWTAKHTIETENALFNKKFQIFAADEHNAFYILTPSLMEKIEAFSKAVEEQIAIAFRGESMFVAVNGWGDIFDPSIHQPVARQKEKILKDMKLLEQAVDILLCIG